MVFVFVNLNIFGALCIFRFVPRTVRWMHRARRVRHNRLVYRTVITARNYYVNVKELVKSLLATVFRLVLVCIIACATIASHSSHTRTQPSVIVLRHTYIRCLVSTKYLCLFCCNNKFALCLLHAIPVSTPFHSISSYSKCIHFVRHGMHAPSHSIYLIIVVSFSILVTHTHEDRKNDFFFLSKRNKSPSFSIRLLIRTVGT